MPSTAKFSRPEMAATWSYGTAGFRAPADQLSWVVYRVGLAAALRSVELGGAVIGAMITASHNPEEDNGIKMIDPSGGMLDQVKEYQVTEIVNEPDRSIMKIIERYRSDLSSAGSGKEDNSVRAPQIAIAKDTRRSSDALVDALIAGVLEFDANAVISNFGLLTTPQLHFVVHQMNIPGGMRDREKLEEHYYAHISTGFEQLLKNNEAKVSCDVIVDCANGVGGVKAEKLVTRLDKLINIRLVNAVKANLNEKCGADFVKIQQQMPFIYDGELKPIDSVHPQRMASIDGDADRLVYYYKDDASAAFHLLDGDKIACLLATFILDQLKALDDVGIKLGVVQTAYANGSSTAFLKESLSLAPACVPTGVKHLHAAAEHFDIGLYFEANGHGTVLFGKECLKRLRSALAATSETDVERRLAINNLLALSQVINQTVGDAFSDLLAAEAILATKKWSIAEWNAIYEDVPCRQLKVKVADRRVIQTEDAERRVCEPAKLQEAIDTLVGEYSKGRSFVRPSGTEDVVRVYAEAETQDLADKLAAEVSVAVFDFAGGVGARPSA